MNFPERVATVLESTISFRRVLHENPELAMQEFGTTKRIIEELEQLPGLEIRDEKPGVVVVLRGGKPGKTLALRGDLDGLPSSEETGLPFSSRRPGVCHSCGHDLHAAILLGCVRVLHGLRDSLNGTIKFFFQPAEETLQGALHLIRKGCLDNPAVDAVIGVHTWPFLPVGYVALRNGPMMAAADWLDLTVLGREGHAAQPHLGVDPVSIAAQVLNALQVGVTRQTNAVDAVVLSIATIHGGTARNVFPDKVIMTGTVRTLSQPVRDDLQKKIRHIAVHTAQAFGGKCLVDYIQGSPPLINDEKLTELLKTAATRELGKDKVKKIPAPVMGGEDFAFYLTRTPGALFRVGTANKDPRTRRLSHDPALVFDEGAIGVGIQVMCRAAVEYLNGDSDNTV
jgi:amidohydrolase